MSCNSCKGSGKVKCKCKNGIIVSNKSGSVKPKFSITGFVSIKGSASWERTICPVCNGTEWKQCGLCNNIPIILQLTPEQQHSKLISNKKSYEEISKEVIISPRCCKFCSGVLGYYDNDKIYRCSECGNTEPKPISICDNCDFKLCSSCIYKQV